MKKFTQLSAALLLTIIGIISCNLDTDILKEDQKKPVSVTKGEYRFYSLALEQWLQSHEDNDSLKVLIGVKDDSWDMDFGMPDMSGEMVIEDNMITSDRLIQGKEIVRDLEMEKEMLEYANKMKLEHNKEKAETLLAKLESTTRSGAKTGEVSSMYTTITTTLTKKEIQALSSQKDLIDGVEVADQQQLTDGIFSDMAPWNTEMGLSTIAHPNGLDGTGVGVYISDSDGEIPNVTDLFNEEPDFNFYKYTTIYNYPSTSTWHLGAVTGIVQAAAPDASLFGSGYRLLPNPLSYDPPIYIGSNTTSNDISSGGTYNILDRDYDNYVYNNRIAIFKSAGNIRAENPTDHVNTPGKAYNVITVGTYNQYTNTVISVYRDPETGMEKPEIVTPNTCCTSVSTPLAAGFAACLMEGYYNRFKLRPQLMKATIMAGATKNIEGSARLSEYDGAGGVDFYNAAYNGNAWWWDGANDAYFDSDNKITIDANLTEDTRYRIVISWLVPGTYIFNNKEINMDIDLRVKYNGNTQASSISTDNSFEIVDFTAAYTGTHQIEIKRYSNSGEGRIIMGMALKRI